MSMTQTSCVKTWPPFQRREELPVQPEEPERRTWSRKNCCHVSVEEVEKNCNVTHTHALVCSSNCLFTWRAFVQEIAFPGPTLVLISFSSVSRNQMLQIRSYGIKPTSRMPRKNRYNLFLINLIISFLLNLQTECPLIYLFWSNSRNPQCSVTVALSTKVKQSKSPELHAAGDLMLRD